VHILPLTHLIAMVTAVLPDLCRFCGQSLLSRAAGSRVSLSLSLSLSFFFFVRGPLTRQARWLSVGVTTYACNRLSWQSVARVLKLKHNLSVVCLLCGGYRVTIEMCNVWYISPATTTYHTYTQLEFTYISSAGN